MISMFSAIFRSFGYAFRGIWRTLKGERNFRIHIVAVVFVTWFAFLYEVTVGQALVLVLLCGFVLSMELINTALEHAVDLTTDAYHPLAERSKDAAAGGVLISCIVAVISAVLLFRDPVHWKMVLDKMTSPLRIIILIIFLVLALFFVRGKKNSSKK